jgi:hypothetical protein
LLFRWFLAMEREELRFDHCSFTTNRARLLEHDVAGEFSSQYRPGASARVCSRTSIFTADGTLGEALASLKSLKASEQKPEKGTDDSGQSDRGFPWPTSFQCDPSLDDRSGALLARNGKGREAKLCYSAYALMGGPQSLLIDFQIEPADGREERRAAVAMADERLAGSHRITLGADRSYETRDFIATSRPLNITPQVAQDETRRGGFALDA